MNSDVMTIKQVADYLQLNVTTVYRLAQTKRIPAVKIGRVWRFHKDRIDKWLADDGSFPQIQPDAKDL